MVIVIAVIAILSAVLIPTFSNVVKDAQNAAAQADARAIYTEYVAYAAEQGDTVETTVYIMIDADTAAKVVNGEAKELGKIATNVFTPEGTNVTTVSLAGVTVTDDPDTTDINEATTWAAKVFKPAA